MDMYEISAIRKTFYAMWYIKKKNNKMVGSDFRYRFFGEIKPLLDTIMKRRWDARRNFIILELWNYMQAE